MPDLREGELKKKVTQVRRRQLLQTWLWQLPICLGGAVAFAAIAYFAQLYFNLETQLTWWGALGILSGMGLLASLILVAMRQPTAVDSALALDDAFNLRERVTTAIGLSDEQKASPAGMALMEDVQKKITQLDVASRFPLAMPRSSWALPAAAAAFALVVMFYNPSQNIEAQSKSTKKKDAAKEEEKVPPIKTEEYKAHNEQRKARIKDIDSEKLQTLENQLDRLLEKVDGTDKASDLNIVAQEASKLAEDIKKRQEELSKVKEMMNKLRNTTDLKDSKDGSNSDLQRAMSEGDMQKAKEELDKLLQSMKEGKLTQEQKEQLAKQLDDLAKKLKEAAEQKERREQVEKSNLDPEAKKKELAKLDKQKEQLKELSQMAEKLSQCKDCLQKGDNEKAEQNLKDASAMIQEMLKDAQEAKDLQAALDDVDKLRQELGDKDGRMKGDRAAGDEEGDPGLEESEDPTEKPGTDKASRGGLRKDRANETKSKDERARSPLDPKGKIHFKGYGPEQPKPDKDTVGKTTVELGEGIQESGQQATEALRGQRIPQAQKNVVGDFYSNLADPNKDKEKKKP